MSWDDSVYRPWSKALLAPWRSHWLRGSHQGRLLLPVVPTCSPASPPHWQGRFHGRHWTWSVQRWEPVAHRNLSSDPHSFITLPRTISQHVRERDGGMRVKTVRSEHAPLAESKPKVRLEFSQGTSSCNSLIGISIARLPWILRRCKDFVHLGKVHRNHSAPTRRLRSGCLWTEANLRKQRDCRCVLLPVHTTHTHTLPALLHSWMKWNLLKNHFHEGYHMRIYIYTCVCIWYIYNMYMYNNIYIYM